MPDPAPPNPAARSSLLDTPPEESFDRLTRLAARLLRAPIALVTLLDVDRQFFKSQTGLPQPFASARQTPLSHSFCQHVVRSREPLVVEDAREDPQLRHNLAIPDLGVVAYAGVPLLDPAGRVLGSFCVIDHEPRQWTAEDLLNLHDLAAAATAEIGLRTELRRAAAAEDALRQSESRFRTVAESANEGIITVSADDRILYTNPALGRIFGYTEAELVNQPLTMLMPTGMREAHRNGMSRYLATGERQIPWDGLQLPALHRDGRELLVEVSFGDAVQGREQVFTGVMRDITERQRTAAALRRSEHSIRRLYEIAARPGDDVDEKIAALLDLGCERFGLPTGMLSRISDGQFTVRVAHSPDPALRAGTVLPLERVYCSATVKAAQPVALTHASRSEWRNHACYTGMGTEAYIGTPVHVDGAVYGTLCFSGPDPVPDEFSAGDREFLQLMAQWVGGEMERQRADQVERQLVAERNARTAADRARLRVQAILENIGDAFFALDEHARFTYVNAEARRFFRATGNRDAAAMLGKNVWDEFPDLIGSALQNIILSTRGREEALEFEHFVPTIQRWLELRIYRTGQGSSIYFRDITERKQNEESRRQSESRFRAVFDGAGIGIALVGLDGRPVEANQALRDMLGYSMDDLRTMTFGTFTHPDDLATDWELFGDTVAGERNDYRVEKRYIRKDGGILWGALNVSLVRDKNGEPQFAIGMVENITERKVAEEALNESQEQLLQAQKMESIGRLAGGVAHDFNNLLTVISGNAALMMPSLPEGTPEREDLQEIERAAQRAAALTRQLLAFSRRDAVEMQPVDLNRTVAGVEKMLRRVIGEDVELDIRLAATPTVVEADPGRMEQVLMNLAVNARDAMPQGGIISVATRHVHTGEGAAPHPAHLAPGRYVVLSVADTGIGMDEATRARVFEPFFTTKEVGKGTGLGLSTVYGIVRQTGGDVVLHSAPGEGTQVEIFLPATAEPATAKPSSAVQAPEAASGTILLVEDEPAVRAIAERVLVGAGYRVLAAAGGAEALGLAAGHTGALDLLLTDLVMPGMSGPTLVSKVRQLFPGVGCLLMTGYNREQAYEDGEGVETAVPVIQKPFQPLELLHAVQQCLRASRPG